MSEKPYLSLIIPAFNEAGRIHWTLDNVSTFMEGFGKPYEIIAVNDGSLDDTHELMIEWAAGRGQDKSLRIVSYEPNRGKGYAVRQGISAARGEHIAFSDADLSAPIDQLTKLFAAVDKGYDIAIGSRAVKGAEIPVHQPFYREWGGKALNLAIRLMAVRGIHDTQCGFKLFRREAALAVFDRCFVDGWSFDIEVLFLARQLGYTISEVPVKWSHAEGSKIKPFRAGVQAMIDIMRIRTHSYAR